MVDDPDARAHEAHVTSDIAEGWDPRSKTKQSEGSPDDADFGAVLSLTNDGLHKDPDEAVAAILQAVKQAKKETRTTIEVESKPICEFTEFSKMLSGGFPAEFPLGVTPEDLGGPGPMKNAQLHRMLKFYDGRVAKNPVLLLWLTNMRMRHKAIGATSAYARKESQEQLVRFMNHEQFERDCLVAEQDPSSTEAKELVQRVGPLLRLAGSKVPWGPLERLSATYHMYAMYHIFGPPAFFITFAPKTITNGLVLKFGCMQADEETEVDLHLPENLQRRVELLASNTIAQARAYSLIVRLVAEQLFGIPCTHHVRTTHKPVVGLFGLPNAFYGVHEVQARNALHAHLLLWVKAVDPKLVHRHVHRPDVRKKFVDIVNSTVTACTEDFEHEYAAPIASTGQVTNGQRVRSAQKHVARMRVQDPYYGQLETNMKAVEARPYYRSYHSYGPGDTIEFVNSGTQRSFRRVIKSKKIYASFREMLVDQTVSACLPDLTDAEITEGERRYHAFANGTYAVKAKRHGVVAFRLCNVPLSVPKKGTPSANPKDTSVAPTRTLHTTVPPTPISGRCPKCVDLTLGEGAAVLDTDADIVPGVCLYDKGGLGWVRVVYADQRKSDKTGRKVLVRPIIHPNGCYLPAPAMCALHRQFNDAIKILASEPTRFQVDFGFNTMFPNLSGRQWCPVKFAGGVQLQVGTLVWVWDMAGASECLTATRLYVRGNQIKAEYNTHCHCFTCHKYKDTFRARYCRMGFGRRASASTRFAMVVTNQSDSKKSGDDTTQERERKHEQSKYDVKEDTEREREQVPQPHV